jgi:hypothetical protein
VNNRLLSTVTVAPPVSDVWQDPNFQAAEIIPCLVAYLTRSEGAGIATAICNVAVVFAVAFEAATI